MRTELVSILQEFGVLWAKPGESFTLASGAKSPYYVDCRRVTLTAKGLGAIVDELIYVLEGGKNPIEYDAVGGPTIGADPIVAGLILASSSKKGFLVRSNRKSHGTERKIEGYVHKGDKVVIVEDVVTSGGSVLDAISAVEEAGAEVVKVVAVLDRLAGAGKALRDYNYEALVTIDDLELPPI